MPRGRRGVPFTWSYFGLLHGLRDLGDQLRQPWSPAGGDVVVQPDDFVVFHRRDDGPACPPGHHRRALAAVGGLVVRQEDELRDGLALMVTAPFPAFTVTGYWLALADALAPEPVLDELLAAQPASMP